MNPVQKLVGAFLERRWDSDPMTRAIEIANSDPRSIVELVRAVIDQIPQGGTFLDASFSFLPDDLWPDAIAYAISNLRAGNKNEAADSVIAYASMQAIPSLQHYLHDIFDIHPNEGSYYEQWPFRAALAADVEYLTSILNQEVNEDSKQRAWLSLLQSRREDALTTTIQHAGAFNPNLQMKSLGLPESLTVNDYFHEVGFDLVGKKPVQLYASEPMHLVFPEAFFENDPPPWLSHDNHPTWKANGPIHAVESFGGPGSTTCNRCGDLTHRLLKLESSLPLAPVASVNRLSIETCLSCLGWEQTEMFYQHDSQGGVQCLSLRSDAPPQFPSGLLKESPVSLVSQGKRWQWQDWALSNSRENLHRIGGHPCWVQSAQYLQCPNCRTTMNFLLQLDSELPTANGEEWLWGSGGLAYVMWCDECRISGLHWQCT